MKRKAKSAEFIHSPLNTPMLDYRVYHMSRMEKLQATVISFLGGGAVGLVFYGGQFLDEEGMATSATMIGNIAIFLLIGFIASCIFVPIREKQLKDKRTRELTNQCREFLSSLTTSLSSGMNMQEAITSAHRDLVVQFSEKSYIVEETAEILKGLKNGLVLEDMLKFFGERSGVEDISNFSTVFALCFRKGGNLKDIVRRTHDIISEKVGIAEEIETSIASNKMQFNCMMVIPILIVIMLRTMSSSFAASFSTPVGVIGMTVAIIIFVVAYKIGQDIMDVKG